MNLLFSIRNVHKVLFYNVFYSSTCAIFAQIQNEGKRSVTQDKKFLSDFDILLLEAENINKFKNDEV